MDIYELNMQVFSTFLSLSCTGIYWIDVLWNKVSFSLSIPLHSGKTTEDVGRGGGGEEKAGGSLCRAKEWVFLENSHKSHYNQSKKARILLDVGIWFSVSSVSKPWAESSKCQSRHVLPPQWFWFPAGVSGFLGSELLLAPASAFVQHKWFSSVKNER